MERVVRITPLSEFPFKIKSVKVKNKKELDVTWREVKNETGFYYEILARNTRDKTGQLKNTITVNTDSKTKPQIQINVGGYLNKRSEPNPPEKHSH